LKKMLPRIAMPKRMAPTMKLAMVKGLHSRFKPMSVQA
jgi:hypothetical protein